MIRCLPALCILHSALCIPAAAQVDWSSVASVSIPSGQVASVSIDGDAVWCRIPYVTDGLIAWYDGIWNAGLGVHSLMTTTWKDLAGGNDATQRLPSGGWQWSQKAYVGTAADGHGFTVPEAFSSTLSPLGQSHTVEIVFSYAAEQRMSLFSQYFPGIGFEYYPTRMFRAYYSGAPDVKTAISGGLANHVYTGAAASSSAKVVTYIDGVQVYGGAAVTGGISPS